MAGATYMEDIGRFPQKDENEQEKPAKQAATLHSSRYPHISPPAARNKMGQGAPVNPFKSQVPRTKVVV